MIVANLKKNNCNILEVANRRAEGRTFGLCGKYWVYMYMEYPWSSMLQCYLRVSSNWYTRNFYMIFKTLALLQLLPDFQTRYSFMDVPCESTRKLLHGIFKVIFKLKIVLPQMGKWKHTSLSGTEPLFAVRNGQRFVFRDTFYMFMGYIWQSVHQGHFGSIYVQMSQNWYPASKRLTKQRKRLKLGTPIALASHIWGTFELVLSQLICGTLDELSQT